MKSIKRIALYAIVAAAALSVVFLNKMSPSEHNLTIYDCFDTVSQLTIYSRSTSPLKKCEEYMHRINDELSAETSGSKLNNYNNGVSETFSPDAEEIINFSKRFSDENPDYFSVYLNPLIQVWDIKNNSGNVPDISRAMAETAQKKELNLGAGTKGYVSDKLAELLRSENIASAMINLGGNTYALGTKPGNIPWKIGIQDPKNSDNIIGVISAQNLAVVTSGDYQRFFESNGTRYHHILDPRTGYPANNGLHSVTIISENAVTADALSTAVFVAGVEEGSKLIKKYNVRGILITDDTVYFSKELEDIFKQETFEYKYEFLY